MRELDENRLFRALCDVIGDFRAHDVIDELANELGGMELRVAVRSYRPANGLFSRALEKAGLDRSETTELLKALSRQKIYVPTRPHEGFN